MCILVPAFIFLEGRRHGIATINCFPAFYFSAEDDNKLFKQGGTAEGSCASGFGICCVLRLESCGGQVLNNVTQVQNPGMIHCTGKNLTEE